MIRPPGASTSMNAGSEGPRAARPLVRLGAAAPLTPTNTPTLTLMLALMLTFALGACADEGDPEVDVPAQPGESAEIIERGPAPEDIEPASAPPTARPTPLAITLEMRAIGRADQPDPADFDLRPGPWSPDGRAIVTWRVVGVDATGRPIGRLGIAAVPDAESEASGLESGAPSVTWESGDVETAFGHERAAAWLRDGTLVIARSDGMLVQTSGEPVSAGDAVSGLRGQVREVLVAPNGRAWLAIGPDRSWLVGVDRVAREISEPAIDGATAWSWRSDSGALAVASGAEYFTLDAATAVVDKIFEIEPVDPERQSPAPRWLTGGRLLVTAPAAPPGDRGGAVHHIVEPAQRTATELHTALDIAINVVSPHDASSWVSPDGRYILYPEVIDSGDGVALRASWIYDVPGARAREHPPVGDPTWSPDGRRFAWVEAGALLVGDVEAAAPIAMADGINVDAGFDPVWSPDGRWLLFQGAVGALYVVRADGLAGPERVGTYAEMSPPPTWSPAGNRFAASIGESPGAAELTIVELSSR